MQGETAKAVFGYAPSLIRCKQKCCTRKFSAEQNREYSRRWLKEYGFLGNRFLARCHVRFFGDSIFP